MKAHLAHKAFTLIELLFVIIIMGIVGSMTLEAIQQYYSNIYRTSEHTKRVAIANQTLDQVAKYFEYAISDSIVRLDKNAPPSGADCDGAPNNTDNPEDEYTFAFVTVDFDGLRGYWDGIENAYRPTWSPSVTISGTTISALDANYTQANTINTLSNATVYMKKTPNAGVCKDFRWESSTATRYNNIVGFTDTNLTLTNIHSETNNKYLLRSGYAFRVVNGELKMYQNFQPWQNETYVTNAEQPMATKVAHFFVGYDYNNTNMMSDKGGIYKLKLCMYGIKEDLSDANTSADHEYQICRERGVYVRY